MYSVGKELENNGFLRDTLTAGKTKLSYNTKPESEEGNIKTVISSISDENLEKLEIIKGELLINTKDINEIKVAQSLGIEVNPYDITEEGELLSSYGNLLLMSEDGTLTIPERVTKIGEGAFANLKGLKTIIIPGTCKEIANNAFRNNTDLENVILEEGVQIIGDSAFIYCSNLSNIQLPESLEDIGANCFWSCSSLNNVTIPSKIKVLKEHTFVNCINLSTIKLSENLERIDYKALCNCNISKIELPASLKKVAGNAFGSNKNLEEINIAEGNNIFEFDKSRGMLIQNNSESEQRTIVFITDKALKLSNILDIPEGVTDFDVVMNDSIEQVNIPASLKNIGAVNLPSTVSNINVDENNNNFILEGKCLYSKDGKRLIICFSKVTKMGKTDFIEGLEVIESRAFMQATNLTDVELPDSILTIGKYAFISNTKLENLKLGTKVSNISPLFKYNNYSGEVTIDGNNANYTIENNILYNKDKTVLFRVLYKINEGFTLPDSVKKIGAYAFAFQSSLKKLNLTNNVNEIESRAFDSTAIDSIYIPAGVKTISSSAFNEMNNLQKIQIDKEKGSIIGSPWGAIRGDKIVEWLR